ncbi:MAG: aspartate/glutamate racemase family protein [Pseudomonadota bacterium]
MHIGLIGGIGPAATVAYYQRLTDAMRAAGAPLDLTIVNADAPTLVANNAADHRAEQATIYSDLIQRLANAGADCAAITSLGGHFCFDETARIVTLPLVSGVRPLDAHFAEQRLGTVGILGTGRIMQTRLFGSLERTAAVVPDDIETVGAMYIEMAVAGTCTDAQRAFFLDQGQSLINKGAEAVVLAGTDLNLAFDGRPVGYPVIDALDIHVSVLVDLATDRTSLSEQAEGVAT